MFSRDRHISFPYQLLELSWYSQSTVGGSLSGLMRAQPHQPPRGEGRGMFSRDRHISSPYQLLELVESVNCRRVSEWAHAGTTTPATTRRGARNVLP
ncbi:hypothetical protein J6590_047941 [Homalodisca vitripennis]|nr:hypothetical protein J6590_047941 [Homalodisca vitripennis]